MMTVYSDLSIFLLVLIISTFIVLYSKKFLKSRKKSPDKIFKMIEELEKKIIEV